MEALLKEENILYAGIMAGQYLPTWRPGRDYREAYSASVDQGGGVLRDLSHELDYTLMLFGEIITITAFDEKVSSLAIDADDLFTAIGRTSKGTVINLTLDYISKHPLRRMIVHSDRLTVEADLVDSTMRFWDETGNGRTVKEPIERNHTYRKMHEALLRQNGNRVCTLSEALTTMKLIDRTSHYNRKDHNVR